MMMIGVALLFTLAMNGMLAGMTVDQSVKQLPARRRIGASAYSRYSRASDLENGVALYAVFGLGAPLSSIALAVLAVQQNGWHAPMSVAAVISAGLTLVQLALTSRAAPTNFSQRRFELSDETALTAVFDRFEFLQTWRTLVVVLAFIAVLGVAASMLVHP